MTSPATVDLDTERAHGLHLGPPQAGHEHVDWRKWPPHGTVRLISETCECKARVYELGAAAGLRFIARIDREPGKRDVVVFAGPMLAARADKLWQRIITGEAR